MKIRNNIEKNICTERTTDRAVVMGKSGYLFSCGFTSLVQRSNLMVQKPLIFPWLRDLIAADLCNPWSVKNCLQIKALWSVCRPTNVSCWKTVTFLAVCVKSLTNANTKFYLTSNCYGLFMLHLFSSQMCNWETIWEEINPQPRFLLTYNFTY